MAASSASAKRPYEHKQSNGKKQKTTNAVDPSKFLDNISIAPEVASIEKEIVANRRHLHKHPELSFQENETAKFVAAQLRSYNNGVIKVQVGVGRTGVVGLLQGGAGSGPCVALRADMDGLPVEESTGLEFASVNKNVMHACGHDGHMAILLGVASILSSPAVCKTLKGTVKFIFQPAEEGLGGAREMIKDNVLESPHVDEIYGLHLWNYAYPGQIVVKHGALMAASDHFEIVVSGKGGHGAVPQGTNDAVVAASHLVTQLHTIVSRNISPLDKAVLTVGTIRGGFNYNVIADEVKLSGTVRTLLDDSQELIKSRIEDLCQGVGKGFGVEAKLHYSYGYPATVNSSPPHVDKLVAAARSVVPTEQVDDKYQGTMCAEDMSYFLQKRPGCFFFVGSAPGDLTKFPHHKSNFTVDERALLIGASIMLRVVRDTCK